MAKVRTAARVDGNHAEILATARSIGASVLDTHQLPNCFDALIGYRGREFIIEIKDPAQPKSGRKLTPGEASFRDAWRGSEYHIIETGAELIKVLTAPPKTPKNFPSYQHPLPHVDTEPSPLPVAPSEPAQVPAAAMPGLSAGLSLCRLCGSPAAAAQRPTYKPGPGGRWRSR